MGTRDKTIETLERFAKANDDLAEQAPFREPAAKYRGAAQGLRKAVEVLRDEEKDDAEEWARQMGGQQPG